MGNISGWTNVLKLNGTFEKKQRSTPSIGLKQRESAYFLRKK